MHLNSRHITVGVMDKSASVDPRELLLARRLQLLTDLQLRAREVREAGVTQGRPHLALEDNLDACADDDLSIAMIRMRVDMLQRVDEAVRQCEAGTYGHCLDCSRHISAARLMAMPFAVRCRECQEHREEHRAHQYRHHRAAQVLANGARAFRDDV